MSEDGNSKPIVLVIGKVKDDEYTVVYDTDCEGSQFRISVKGSKDEILDAVARVYHELKIKRNRETYPLCTQDIGYEERMLMIDGIFSRVRRQVYSDALREALHLTEGIDIPSEYPAIRNDE